jgi:hypothetical protein
MILWYCGYWSDIVLGGNLYNLSTHGVQPSTQQSYMYEFVQLYVFVLHISAVVLLINVIYFPALIFVLVLLQEFLIPLIHLLIDN